MTSRFGINEVAKLVRDTYGISMLEALGLLKSFGATEPGRLEIASRVLAANLGHPLTSHPASQFTVQFLMEIHANSALMQADKLIAAHNAQGVEHE